MTLLPYSMTLNDFVALVFTTLVFIYLIHVSIGGFFRMFSYTDSIFN